MGLWGDGGNREDRVDRLLWDRINVDNDGNRVNRDGIVDREFCERSRCRRVVWFLRRRDRVSGEVGSWQKEVSLLDLSSSSLSPLNLTKIGRAHV